MCGLRSIFRRGSATVDVIPSFSTEAFSDFFFFCLFADVFHSGSAYFVSLGVRTKRVCILEMPSITPVYGGGGDG